MMMRELVAVDAGQKMSNLTSSAAAGELINASAVSSSSINASTRSTDVNISSFCPRHPFASPNQPPPPPLPPKKKRSLPGNPDPNAEVIALSPKSLLATNRFVCEVCNKGFQRDQNLQLHRRGHNLPWKLKQRPKDQPPKKKVYVCPEPTCAHHEPSRALGDLTGIKKHFCRKHGERKWKCNKCSKRYAVLSDWKAHSKICGTKEYRCHCGTLFSRRDSFITHRAFCDALAGERAPLLPPQPPLGATYSSTPPLPLRLKKEPHQQPQQQQQQSFNSLILSNLPPWLSCPQPNYQSPPTTHPGQSPGPSATGQIELTSLLPFMHSDNQNPNPRHGLFISSSSPPLPPPLLSASASAAHMSATALLQKAAQMGVTISNKLPSSSSSSSPPFSCSSSPSAHHHHVNMTGRGHCLQASHVSTNANSSGHGLPPSSEQASLAYYSHDNYNKMLGGDHGEFNDVMMMSSFSSSSASSASSSSLAGFEDSLMINGGLMINPGSSVTRRGGGEGDGMTRDFLGLRSVSQKELLNMTCGIDRHLYHHNEQQQVSFPYGQKNNSISPSRAPNWREG